VSDVIGTMESIKLEFYRQVVVPYEDYQQKTNGRCWGAAWESICRVIGFGR